MGPRRCCCNLACLIAEDDFNRADSADPGPLWYAPEEAAEIDDNAIRVSALTSIRCVQNNPLGSVVATFKMIDAATDGTFRIKVGDPAGDLDVLVEFAGTAGAGGTMTVTLLGVGPGLSWEYPWDNAVEELQVCYHPTEQFSARPTQRTNQSEHPAAITTCINTTAERCWDRGTEEVGNFHFVEGYFDDFELQVHGLEKRGCPNCDCYCDDDIDVSCVPASLLLHLESIGAYDCAGIDGAYTLTQRRSIGLSPTSDPTLEDWPEKRTWVSGDIGCPGGNYTLQFILTCTGNTFGLLVYRRESGGSPVWYSALGFDRDDPDTINPSTGGDTGNTSDADVSFYECDPISMSFPDIVEDMYTGAEDSCCGGGISSGGEDPPARWSVLITEVP